MSDQPEALRLAEFLEEAAGDYWRFDKHLGYASADLLRRQRAEIKRLRAETGTLAEKLMISGTDNAGLRAEIESLKVESMEAAEITTDLREEIQRLREYADTLVRERNAAWAESAELRADAGRFVWWFSDTHKSGEFIAEYLRLMRAHATLDEWRAAIDAAMEAK